MKRQKFGLRFKISRIFSAALKFESMQRHLTMIFGTKARKRSKEIPVFKYYTPARTIPIVVTVYLLLNIKYFQSILGHCILLLYLTDCSQKAG